MGGQAAETVRGDGEGGVRCRYRRQSIFGMIRGKRGEGKGVEKGEGTREGGR